MVYISTVSQYYLRSQQGYKGVKSKKYGNRKNHDKQDRFEDLGQDDLGKDRVGENRFRENHLGENRVGKKHFRKKLRRVLSVQVQDFRKSPLCQSKSVQVTLRLMKKQPRSFRLFFRFLRMKIPLPKLGKGIAFFFGNEIGDFVRARLRLR